MSKLKQEYVSKLDKIRYSKSTTYSFLNCNRLKSIVAPFEKGNLTVIGGAPGVGLTSFTDELIVMNLLKFEEKLVALEGEIPEDKLIIHYFALGKSELEAVLNLASLYIKHSFGIAITPSDMRGDTNANINLYDPDFSKLTPEQASVQKGNIGKIKKCIDVAIDWVASQVSEGFLSIHSGMFTPSDIYNTLMTDTFFIKYGKYNKETKVYTFNEQYMHSQFIVFIDSTLYLKPDTLGHGTISDTNLHKLMLEYIDSIRFTVKAAIVVSVPTEVKFARSYKDTEPVRKHLGVYGTTCSTGIILYDPVAEKHKGLLPKEQEDATSSIMAASTPKGKVIDAYIDAKGSNFLRHWFVVRNTSGPSNANQRLVMYPGIGAFKEFPEGHDFDRTAQIKSYILKNK